MHGIYPGGFPQGAKDLTGPLEFSFHSPPGSFSFLRLDTRKWYTGLITYFTKRGKPCCPLALPANPNNPLHIASSVMFSNSTAKFSRCRLAVWCVDLVPVRFRSIIIFFLATCALLSPSRAE